MAKEKQQIYESLKPYDEIVLDCYGYVSGIRGLENKQVEGVLMFPSGQKSRRLFKSNLTDLFIKAGVYFRDAPFRFIVTKYQGEFSDHIINEKPPEGYPGTVKMPKFDFSVLEPFERKEEGL